ncbi:hypothetical protein NDU88_007922 [Pleurodeles waltl]|uniref:Uncharacterized protein n=1 Tax=Pleurodeles waltl TaxID=8319 RepID=A0AAV7NXD5_PLEWA|nr:hypothetical protein NDU88_007922 [Pleurodeles waltl]
MAASDHPVHRSPCAGSGQSTQKDINEGFIEKEERLRCGSPWLKHLRQEIRPDFNRGQIGSLLIVGTTDDWSIDSRTGSRGGLEGMTGISTDPVADPEGTSVAVAGGGLGGRGQSQWCGT